MGLPAASDSAVSRADRARAVLTGARARRLGASALSGAALGIAGPPLAFPAITWLALAAFALTLEELPASEPATRLARRLAGGGRGLAFGVGANVIFLRFVPAVIARFTPLPWSVGVLALLLLATAQALAWAAAGIATVGLTRAGLPRAPAFAIAVFVATLVPCIFPWSPAGALTPWPRMVQLADLVGERGVSAIVGFTAALIAGAARAPRRAWLPAGAAAALTLLLVLYGTLRIAHVEAERAGAKTVKVGLVQPSIGATDRWKAESAPSILDGLTALTRSSEHRGAALTVWPEAAYPYAVGHASRRAPIGPWAVLPAGVRGPVLTGLVLTAEHGDSYNSAMVVHGDGTLSEPYDKLHLLWFGESVPLAAQLPWLRRTFARGFGMVPGDRSVLLEAGEVRAGVLICFEDVLPEAGREAAARAPNLLVGISNDAWLRGSPESEEHLQLAVLRAVETRKDLVRAVNFGPTSWVDAAGLVRARYASDLPGTLVGEPALLEGITPYARVGDAPLLALAALLTGVALVSARRRTASSP